MSVKVEYGGVAIGAKESFVPTAIDKATFVDLSELQQEGLFFPNFGNPCESYSVALDGKSLPLSNDNDENFGWWSEQISNEYGVFETPIVLTLTANEKYTSSGITLMFDIDNNIFVSEVNIQWYRDDEFIIDMDFFPDSAFYFCQNKVEYYDKIIITFKKLNMPYNRLKLRSLEYGMRVEFFGDELRNTLIVQEINPISTEIPISTFDFRLDSNRNIQYAFQERQPLKVSFNDKLISTTFVKNAKRISKNIWDITSEDYISILDKTRFKGGMYSNTNVVELFNEISETSKVPFEIAEEINSKTVSGYIPYTSCREALMQICFAIGVVVYTANSDKIRICLLDDSLKRNIKLEDMFTGLNQDIGIRVTAVELTAHTYLETEEETILYNAIESGIGERILIIFNQPAYGLKITNGVIVESGVNYAIITATSNCILTGKLYQHITQSKKLENPFYLALDGENIISIENATLINSDNIDNVLNLCYNYYKTNKKINANVIDYIAITTHEGVLYGQSKYGEFRYGNNTKLKKSVNESNLNVGDIISVETEYDDEQKGIITKQSFSLVGKKIVKKMEMKGI